VAKDDGKINGGEAAKKIVGRLCLPRRSCADVAETAFIDGGRRLIISQAVDTTASTPTLRTNDRRMNDAGVAIETGVAKHYAVGDHFARYTGVTRELNGSAVCHQHSGESGITAQRNRTVLGANIKQNVAPLHSAGENDPGVPGERELSGHINNECRARRSLKRERRITAHGEVAKL
jgi:hypothetical protein